MKLVACKQCHAQYDVRDVAAPEIPCRCGATIAVEDLASRDLAVHRCSACGAHVDAQRGECAYCGARVVVDPRLLSLICPECCARNANDARFCGACGVLFDPQPLVARKRELPCPECSVLMPARSVAGVVINECPGCHGLWCPEQGFEALIARAGEPGTANPQQRPPRKKMGNPTSQGVRYRKCPECDAFMQRRNFRKTSGVIVDSCAAHGTWLDADELEQIAGYLASGGRPHAERFMRESAARDEMAYRVARATGQLGEGAFSRGHAPGGGFGAGGTQGVGFDLGRTLLGLLRALCD